MAVKISDLPQASNVASTDVLVANVGGATSKLPYSVVQTSIRSLAWCGTAGGTANAITLSPSPAISAYQAGQAFDFVAAATNTGPVTVSISGLSAISVTRGGAAIPASTILAGRAYRIVVTSGSSAELGTDPEGLPRQQVLTFGATTNWDASLGQMAVLTLSGNTTLAAPTNLKAGGHYTLRVVQDSVGGREITWNSAYVGVRGAAMPQPAPSANTTTVYHFVSDGTSLFLVSLSDDIPAPYVPPPDSLIGAVAYFAMSSAPTGWLKANGAAVSRTAYANLFAAIGTTFGAGDGSTTFNLPDLRGEFVRGWDDGRGVDGGRAFGSSQIDTFQGHYHRQYRFDSLGSTGAGNYAIQNYASNTNNTAFASSDTVREAITGVNGAPRTSDETRPRNVALLACIKY